MSSRSNIRSSYRFLTPSPATATDPHPSFEMDESDLYSPNTLLPTAVEPSPARSSSSQRAAASRRSESAPTHPSSLPVDVPDWSKILMGEYRKGGGGYDDGDDEYARFDGDEESGNTTGRGRRGTVTVPPHEFLARQAAKSTTTRVASSVHEGFGRTLKGRDLSRVRNAIWEKTGFQD
ncbi:hypothetical protein MLD38_017289 [Melastoma candidum]|uniref:Uncharacterized protein n=1 Tax=Melastoma candidum TaxID=119954 RepID=A0ACB9QQC8_9MYRT|nr:hypothetical protein MLD38_017289 [Melastoma candidum]